MPGGDKILERLWSEYLKENIRPDADPKELKVIAGIFYSGMMAMVKEILAINFAIGQVLEIELKEFREEMGPIRPGERGENGNAAN